MTKIGWTDRTLNGIVGCSKGCPHCYAKPLARRNIQMIAGWRLTRAGIKYRHLDVEERLELYRTTKTWCEDCFEYNVHEHLDRLKQLTPHQKPKLIFMDSMSDWCDPKVDPAWIMECIRAMNRSDQHIYQILSQIPEGYRNYTWQPHMWLGTTVKTQADLSRVWDLRHNLLEEQTKFVSLEPLHGPIDYVFSGIDWLIIGAETGNRKGRIVPKKEWVLDILEGLWRIDGKKPAVFMKDNLANECWRDQPLLREYPDAINRPKPNRRYGGGTSLRYIPNGVHKTA